MAYAHSSHRRNTELIGVNTRLRMPSMPSIENDPIIGSDTDSIRRVLVPLDGSLSAEHALPHALAVSRRNGALLRLVHVHFRADHVEPWQMYAGQETTERRLDAKQAYLRDVARRAARGGAAQIETLIVENDLAETALLEMARAADLIVMASRRPSWLRGLFSHSVSAGVRRCAGIPVLHVKGFPFPVDLTGNPTYGNTLVPLDGTADAERILRPVKSLGRLHQTTITLLNIQDRDWMSGSFEHTTPYGYLVGIARETAKRYPQVNARIMTTDRTPAAAIASFAEREEIDSIALTIPADGTWWSRKLGDEADALLRRTDLPVLTLAAKPTYERSELLTVVP